MATERIQQEILNITLSAIADTEIQFSWPVSSIIIRNRDAQNMYFRSDDGDSTYYTIEKGTNLAIDLPTLNALFTGFLRAASGTGPAEIIGLKSR